MNILLLFPGFIGALIIVFCYECKKIRTEPMNKVHFYVARDKDGSLWLHIGKPIRSEAVFASEVNIDLTNRNFHILGLNKNDYDYLRWKDEPVEVFINMKE